MTYIDNIILILRRKPLKCNDIAYDNFILRNTPTDTEQKNLVARPKQTFFNILLETTEVGKGPVTQFCHYSTF